MTTTLCSGTAKGGNRSSLCLTVRLPLTILPLSFPLPLQANRMNKLEFTIPRADYSANEWRSILPHEWSRFMGRWILVVKECLELRGLTFTDAPVRMIGGKSKRCWACSHQFSFPVSINYLHFYGDLRGRDVDNEFVTSKATTDALVRLGVLVTDCIPDLSKSSNEFGGQIPGQPHIVEVTIKRHRSRWHGTLDERRIPSTA